MRLRITKLRNGMGPHEVLIALPCLSNRGVEAFVDAQSLRGDFLDVGAPIACDLEKALIELPAETARGTRRIWVSHTDLFEERATL